MEFGSNASPDVVFNKVGAVGGGGRVAAPAASDIEDAELIESTVNELVDPFSGLDADLGAHLGGDGADRAASATATTNTRPRTGTGHLAPHIRFGNPKARLVENVELERRIAKRDGRLSRNAEPLPHERTHMIDNSKMTEMFERIVHSQSNAFDAPGASTATLTRKGYAMFKRLGYGQLVSLSYEDLVVVFAYAKCWWNTHPCMVSESEGLGDFARRMFGLEEHVDAGDGTVPFAKIEAAFELEKLRISELSTMLLVHQLAKAPVPQSERDYLLSLQAGIAGAAGRGGGGGSGGGGYGSGRAGRGGGGRKKKSTAFLDGDRHNTLEDGGVDIVPETPEIDFESDLQMMESRIEALAKVLSHEHAIARLYASAMPTSEPSSYLDPLRPFGSDAESNSEYQALLRFLCTRALENGYKKRGKFIFRQIMSPLLYTSHGGRRSYPTFAWEEAMPISQWVKSETQHYINAAMWRAANNRSNCSMAIKYFEEGFDPELPMYKPDRHFFSFRNGIFWTGAPHAPTWFYYGDPNIPSFATACKYHDRVFPAQDLVGLMQSDPMIDAFLVASQKQTSSTRAASHASQEAKAALAYRAAVETRGAAAPPAPGLASAARQEVDEDEDEEGEGSKPASAAAAAAVAGSKRRRFPHGLEGVSESEEHVDASVYPSLHSGMRHIDEQRMFYNWELIPTPAFDSILLSQLDPEVNSQVDGAAEVMAILRVMYAFFGRLLFDLNEYEHWEVTLNLIGRAGAGKSTIINAITRLFGFKDVGTLANNANERFALQNLLDKMLIVCYEMTEKFGLDPSMWNSMVTGESVTAQVKSKDDVTIYKWLTPMLVAGNEMSGSVDKSGAKVRRIITFFFDCRVPPHKQDPQLDKAIMQEMPFFLAKIAIAYREMATRFGSFSIWAKNVPVYGYFNPATGECIQTGVTSVLPEYFHKAKARLAATSHPLASFLTNEEKLTICSRDDHAFGMPFTRFKEMADAHFKANHLVGISWKESNFIDKLEDRGLKLLTVTSGLLQMDHLRFTYKGQLFSVGTQWVVGVMESDELVQRALEDYPPLTTEEAEQRAGLYASQKDISKEASDVYRVKALQLARDNESAKETELEEGVVEDVGGEREAFEATEDTENAAPYVSAITSASAAAAAAAAEGPGGTTFINPATEGSLFATYRAAAHVAASRRAHARS